MIKKVAFIYLTQISGEYYVTDDPGYSIQRRPQLGLQYLAAVLERKDIVTAIFDQTVFSFDLDWLTEELKGYDMAGFYCSDSQEDKVKEYCVKIKKRSNIPILVGGPSTLSNSTFLDYGCDMVVHGEGEITIQEIIEYYNGEREKQAIKGVSYKDNGRIISAPPQGLIKDLDQLPFPDRSKVDMNSYYDYFLFSMKKPYVTMIASRGCFYRCAFCTAWKIWDYKYRSRSADNVLSEIDSIVNKYGVRYIAFQDDVFGTANDWIVEFCEKLMKRPYRIRWMAILHPFSVRRDRERILKLMRKAGCDTLSFGLQSAHPEILKRIGRHPSEPQELKKVLQIANEFGFLTAVGYIFGLPGDTQETIQATVNYSLACGSTLANYYMLSVLRGSDIEKRYASGEIASLDKAEIERLTKYASQKFYTRPMTVLKIAYFIVKNPGWLIKIGANMPSVLARVGFVKSRDKKRLMQLWHAGHYMPSSF